MKIRCNNAVWNDQIEFLVTDGSRYVTGLVWAEFPNAVRVEPTFALETQQAQALLDALWSCGLRPAEGRHNASTLAATERHLEDMRSLVFKREPKRSELGFELPENPPPV